MMTTQEAIASVVRMVFNRRKHFNDLNGHFSVTFSVALNWNLT